MDTMDEQSKKLLRTLKRLYPRAEIHRILDMLVDRQLPLDAFRTLVWHTMAKTAAEKVSGRKWELVEGDVRHRATSMAVLYTMHCLYERAAKGKIDPRMWYQETEQWTLDFKAG